MNRYKKVTTLLVVGVFSMLPYTSVDAAESDTLEQLIVERLEDSNLVGGAFDKETVNALELIFYQSKATNLELPIANLELANANLELANANMEVVNANLEVANANLELANAILEMANINLELPNANLELANANLELANAKANVNVNLELANAKANVNLELANANLELANANLELTNPNLQLTDALQTGGWVVTEQDVITYFESQSDFPVPGSGEYGFLANNQLSDTYYLPKLRERVLGEYTDVVATEEDWGNLPSDERRAVTLYWKNDTELHGLINDVDTIFDNLNQLSYIPHSTGTLTISAPLRSGSATAYPGCAGELKPLTHVRFCGEVNPDVLSGSEVFSQRWTRLNDVEPITTEKYPLNAQVTVNRILTSDVLLNTPIAFEMSVSTVPGDFSDKACKPNSALQYATNRAINVTQVGFLTTLPATCQVSVERSKHYYINVRAVNIDTVNLEINESICNISTGCKYQLDVFLDNPPTPEQQIIEE